MHWVGRENAVFAWLCCVCHSPTPDNRKMVETPQAGKYFGPALLRTCDAWPLSTLGVGTNLQVLTLLSWRAASFVGVPNVSETESFSSVVFYALDCAFN
eukprot:5822299-Amphidinium_carterae.1